MQTSKGQDFSLRENKKSAGGIYGEDLINFADTCWEVDAEMPSEQVDCEIDTHCLVLQF